MPIDVFAVFCVPALVFSILAVMPSRATGKSPVGGRDTSLRFSPLFFMDFTQIPREQFHAEMDRIIRDPAELYKDLANDIHNAGLVLRIRKYRYLRLGYVALLSGISFGGVALVAGLLLT